MHETVVILHQRGNGSVLGQVQAVVDFHIYKTFQQVTNAVEPQYFNCHYSIRIQVFVCWHISSVLVLKVAACSNLIQRIWLGIEVNIDEKPLAL